MNKLRQTLIIWVSLFPPLCLLLYFLGPHLRELPLMISTLINTVILVPLMVFVLVPFWTYIFDKIQGKK